MCNAHINWAEGPARWEYTAPNGKTKHVVINMHALLESRWNNGQKPRPGFLGLHEDFGISHHQLNIEIRKSTEWFDEVIRFLDAVGADASTENLNIFLVTSRMPEDARAEVKPPGPQPRVAPLPEVKPPGPQPRVAPLPEVKPPEPPPPVAPLPEIAEVPRRWEHIADYTVVFAMENAESPEELHLSDTCFDLWIRTADLTVDERATVNQNKAVFLELIKAAAEERELEILHAAQTLHMDEYSMPLEYGFEDW